MCHRLYAPHSDNLRQDEAVLISSSFFAVEVTLGRQLQAPCVLFSEKSEQPLGGE